MKTLVALIVLAVAAAGYWYWQDGTGTESTDGGPAKVEPPAGQNDGALEGRTIPAVGSGGSPAKAAKPDPRQPGSAARGTQPSQQPGYVDPLALEREARRDWNQICEEHLTEELFEQSMQSPSVTVEGMPLEPHMIMDIRKTVLDVFEKAFGPKAKSKDGRDFSGRAGEVREMVQNFLPELQSGSIQLKVTSAIGDDSKQRGLLSSTYEERKERIVLTCRSDQLRLAFTMNLTAMNPHGAELMRGISKPKQ